MHNPIREKSTHCMRIDRLAFKTLIENIDIVKNAFLAPISRICADRFFDHREMVVKFSFFISSWPVEIGEQKAESHGKRGVIPSFYSAQFDERKVHICRLGQTCLKQTQRASSDANSLFSGFCRPRYRCLSSSRWEQVGEGMLVVVIHRFTIHRIRRELSMFHAHCQTYSEHKPDWAFSA